MCSRIEEEAGAKQTLQKQIRELENQVQELTEDLDIEKEARAKAEKSKRDQGEVRAKLSSSMYRTRQSNLIMGEHSFGVLAWAASSCLHSFHTH